MAKNENRKKFLKNAGILGLAGLFGFSKMGNMPIVKAAVNDNAEAKDISNDIIRCNTNDVFNSGETAAELADAVNGLNASFSSALTDLKNTDVAKAVGANGSKFPTVTSVLGTIKTYLSGAVSKSVQVGSSYKIPAGYHDGSSEITAVAKSGTNPTKITTNGTHSTGGYESVNVQVYPNEKLYCESIVPSEPILYEYGVGSDYCHFTIKANDASAKVSNNKIIITLNETVTAIGRYSGGASEYTRRIQIQFDLI